MDFKAQDDFERACLAFDHIGFRHGLPLARALTGGKSSAAIRSDQVVAGEREVAAVIAGLRRITQEGLSSAAPAVGKLDWQGLEGSGQNVLSPGSMRQLHRIAVEAAAAAGINRLDGLLAGLETRARR
jgi:hypothetical protein